MYSCDKHQTEKEKNINVNKQTTATSNTPEKRYIRINDYNIEEKSYDLFLSRSDQEVIQIEYLSNFPPETVILIEKGLRLHTTNQEALRNSSTTDTIILSQNKFEVPFSPSFMPGYVAFTISASLQNEKIKELFPPKNGNDDLYYITTNIDYKNADTTASLVAIPEPPIQLLFEESKPDYNFSNH